MLAWLRDGQCNAYSTLFLPSSSPTAIAPTSAIATAEAPYAHAGPKVQYKPVARMGPKARPSWPAERCFPRVSPLERGPESSDSREASVLRELTTLCAQSVRGGDGGREGGKGTDGADVGEEDGGEV